MTNHARHAAAAAAVVYVANLATQYGIMHHLAGRKAGIKLGK